MCGNVTVNVGYMQQQRKGGDICVWLKESGNSKKRKLEMGIKKE